MRLKNEEHLDRSSYHFRNALQWARKRARAKGIPCTITRDWCIETYTGYCSLSGVPLETGPRGGSPFSPSLDRIDNTKGYTPENTRWVAMSVNAFLGTMDDKCALRVARGLVRNLQYTDYLWD